MEKVKRTPASLPELVKEFNMEILTKAPNFATQTVTISDVNRPALQLVGFYEYFEPIRLQILGKAEMVFLQGMTTERRRKVLEDLLRCEIPALIIARNMEVPPELLELAEKHGRTLLRIDRKTVDATSEIIDYLNKMLAPQITRHGVLMNINGQGVLLLGDSGKKRNGYRAAQARPPSGGRRRRGDPPHFHLALRNGAGAYSALHGDTGRRRRGRAAAFRHGCRAV